MARIWKGTPLGFTKGGTPIAWDGNEPVTILGPPGSSKTVGIAATMLLDDDSGKRSYFVNDPKGELCAITSKFRRSLPGHQVWIVNGYGVLVDQRPDMKSDCCNLMNSLPKADALTFGDECQALAAAFIEITNQGQPHFDIAARSATVLGLMAEVIDADAQGVARSLPNVIAKLLQDAKGLRTWIEAMVASGNFDLKTRAAKFLNENTEIQNIKSTIEAQFSWCHKALRDDMATKKGVNFHTFATQPTTIYWIVPTPELKPKAVYFRAAISLCLRALYRYDGVPATLLIEEGYVLGRHDELAAAASILRGYNSRFAIVFQSLQQAVELYPQTYGLFMSGALLAFRPADLGTAKELCARAGKEIVPVRSSNEPRPGELVAAGGWQQRERERIPITKLFGMPRGRALVWLPHDEVPRISWVRGYFDTKLNARASRNPYFKGGNSRAGRIGKAAIALTVAAAVAGAALVNRNGVALPAMIPAAWWGGTVHQSPPAPVKHGPTQSQQRRATR